MASDPLSAIEHLQSVVTMLAPSLCPQVLPRGVHYGLDLILSLCKTEDQRRTVMAMVQRCKPTGTQAPQTHQNEEETDQEENDGDCMEPQVLGAFDVTNRVFAVQKIQWMHKRDAVVHEFARFMELQLDQPIAAKEVVLHFLEVNGYTSDRIMLAQQCFSAAFALQTLLRAFPKLPIAIDGKVVEITKDSDVAEVFAPLLAPKATANKHTSKAKETRATQMHKPATKGKSKQPMMKKRKST